MAFEAATNGVQSLVATEGIAIRNIRARDYQIGIDLKVEASRRSAVRDDPWPAGLYRSYFGVDFDLNQTGQYLVLLAGIAGDNPGAIVIGPNDRMYIQLVNKTDLTIRASIEMELYNRDAADTSKQYVMGSSILTGEFRGVYRATVLVFNESGTLKTSGFKARMSLIPLTSLYSNIAQSPLIEEFL